MTQDKYNDVVVLLLAQAYDIETAKRPAYTIGSDDVLHNFKTQADRFGITARQALGVHLSKHLDAIISALKDPTILQAEDITGRFSDAINYLKLGYALIKEEEDAAREAVIKEPITV